MWHAQLFRGLAKRHGGRIADSLTDAAQALDERLRQTDLTTQKLSATAIH
jgi:hypothetical protein